MDCEREKQTVNRGNSKSITIFVNINGVGQDITGWTFWHTVRTKPAPLTTLNDDDAVMHKQVGPIVDGSNSLVTFFYDASETMVEIRKYISDYKFKKDDGVTIQSLKIIDFEVLPNAGQST